MQNILTFIKNGQKFTLDASNIKSVRDTGNGFEITLKSGEIIQADSYSITPNTQPVEQVSSQQVENNSEADEEFEKEEVLKEKSLLDSQTMLWGGAAIALGGIAIAASGSGGSDGSAPSDQTPPASLTKILSKDGKAVSGLTEAGATVIVENSAGKVIGSAKAGADGTYLINLDKAYINGEILKVSAQDTAGNSTVKQELIASDITAPTLTHAISSNGKTITGLTEANSTVTVKDSSGKIIGTAKSDNDGKYTVILDKAYLNGENLTISAEDLAGNKSTIQTILADDKTAPIGLTVAIDTAGKVVTGVTEANAVVTVKNAAGIVVGIATADVTGKYSVTLDKAYLNGESLNVTAADNADNATVPKIIVAPDTTAPSSLTATIDAAGKVITGVTEANATVTVKNVVGTVVGTGTADATGKYSVTLDKAYLNGESLNAIAADKVGNTTTPKTIIAPDTTAPSSLTATIDAAGKVITGVTEANATVTVKNVVGTVVGTGTADVTGKYSVTLDKIYLNGESLSAIAADKAGNTTAATTIIASDTTAPSSLIATIDASGKVVTGITEANAVVTVKNTAGTVVGTGTADATGKYSITLDKAYLNGESLNAIAADKVGNTTTPKTIIAPDTTAPSSLTATIDAAGKVVAGVTEADARVTVEQVTAVYKEVTVLENQFILSESVQTNYLSKTYSFEVTGTNAHVSLNLSSSTNSLSGSYSSILSGASLNTRLTGNVSQAGDGNYSIDLAQGSVLPPGTYTLTVNYSSSMVPVINVNVTQEVPTTILEVDHYETKVVGTANADEAGNYSITLDKDYLNGENLIVTATDQSGNKTEAKEVIVPDITPPILHQPTIQGGWTEGQVVQGTTEANVTVTIKNAAGDVIGSAIADASGHYTVILNTVYENGESLKVIATDNKGNENLLQLNAPDTTAPILTNLFSYDLSTDKIIFNAPSDSYFVEQKIDGAWVHVNIEEKFDWLNVEYRVTATDQAGNSSQPLTTIINTASGTYKPTDPTFTQIIKGSTGNDYLYGSNGDDTLISNGDSDRLYGGSGNDTLIYGGNSPNVYTGLIGEAGNDTYIVDKALLGSLSYVHILDNTNEQNTLYLKSVSADEIILKQTSADRVITFNDSTATIHFGEGQLSSIVFDDGTVWNKAQIEANTIGKLLGTDAADNLQADAEISTIYGLGGNDTIQGGVQNDYLYGDDGDDTLVSNTGSDYLYGGAGNDTLIYGGNSNVYTALQGQAGNDTYIIDKALLTSSSYIHILDNATEENTLQLKSVSSSDISLKQSDSLIIISFNDSASTIRFGKDNLSFIVFDDGTVWDKAQIEANTIGKLLGTDAADNLQADAEISTIYSLGGNDTIQGGVQNDYLYGGDGDDTLVSNTGSDYLYGGSGNDTLIYGGNSNVYTALQGQAGNDTYIVDKALLTSSSSIHILDNAAEENILQLKSVSSGDISLKQSDSLIIISFNDSASTIRFGEGQLSSIVFDDGTVWDKAQIEQHIAEPVFGTTGNDVIETNIPNQSYSYILGDGADTVVFNILDNTDNLGGNVKTEWTDFNLVENDKIDFSQLLINDSGDLQDYITVKDTEAGLIISVDRDGSSQSTYHSQELILLTGKHYTLEDLMASNAFIH
ncbi:type I secretion C-terminal target domain protein [Acinetobacter baumannii 25569_2]|uniref:Ig-like domain-containing protein n=2 Tax=Acinetobacter baumannii TaxID=470 RepID=UPI0002BACE7A|nr:type I secretion C-terminal target domain-containing protein [Acinetobacter baumannii]EXD43490.1 type I secretion C-terminal target domain protein [Acinetobacter baumannii 562700]EXQ85112.1 type I secretion C-terminal target domain protein [Acinetobacter baumannii 1058283]EYS45461.1 type I secretion C-terminal target domain protein [Acinetobacter baumannii 25569_2]EYT40999.1 type I secretion C-terminal target domain protein [Acinetobacter baumannii 1039621]KCX04837.1 type I secretion C-term